MAADQRLFISERDLQAITGISSRTWQKYRLHDKGPRFYKIGGNVRYHKEEVLAWVQSQAYGGRSDIREAAVGQR